MLLFSLWISPFIYPYEGIFKVFGKPGAFFWHVYGSRHKIDVEPLKASVDLKGSGPYKWI
jgi:hypothetical protein